MTKKRIFTVNIVREIGNFMLLGKPRWLFIYLLVTGLLAGLVKRFYLSPQCLKNTYTQAQNIMNTS